MADARDVVMYTKPFCPYCAAARALLGEKGVDFHEIDISKDAGRREEMIRRSGRHTVPQVFAGAEHLGGYDDIAALDQEGRLDALLGITG